MFSMFLLIIFNSLLFSRTKLATINDSLIGVNFSQILQDALKERLDLVEVKKG
jgi:hypothetical protein